MTDKELRKLGRTELLEMLLNQGKEVELLRQQLEEARTQLEDRQLRLDEAGNIAEAALQVSKIFEAAQQAADLYVENIAGLNERQSSVCARLERESQEQADRLLEETQRKCEEMTEKAKKEAQEYWSEVSEKLEEFYASHAGLQELLAVRIPVGS